MVSKLYFDSRLIFVWFFLVTVVRDWCLMVKIHTAMECTSNSESEYEWESEEEEEEESEEEEEDSDEPNGAAIACIQRHNTKRWIISSAVEATR